MRFSTFPLTKIAAALCAAASLAVPSLAGAQQNPSYSTASQQSVRGTITGFNGAYTVYVQDEKGYGDNVEMHDGTVINPTGIKLHEGMHVTVYGYPNGKQFDAWRIDVSPPQNTGYNGGNGNYGNGGNYGYGGGMGPGGGYGYGSPYGGYPYGGYPYGGYPYGGYPYGGYPYGGFGYGGYPWWGVGIGFSFGYPFFGGYPFGYPFFGGFNNPVIIQNPPVVIQNPGGGTHIRNGTVTAPVHGSAGAPVHGTFGAPVHGTVQGRPPRP